MIVSLFILLVELLCPSPREELSFYFSAIASSPLGFLLSREEKFPNWRILKHFHKHSQVPQEKQGHWPLTSIIVCNGRAGARPILHRNWQCSGSFLNVFIHILHFAETAQNINFVMGTSKLPCTVSKSHWSGMHKTDFSPPGYFKIQKFWWFSSGHSSIYLS